MVTVVVAVVEVGLSVGLIVGDPDGDPDGSADGASVGPFDGASVGGADGPAVGDTDGEVGATVGDTDGDTDGGLVGIEVVGLALGETLGKLVGLSVVTQSWNPPASNASAIAFIDSAAAAPSSRSNSRVPNAHEMTSGSPPGPRYATIARESSAAVPSTPVHPASTTKMLDSTSESSLTSQLTCSGAPGQAASTRLRAATWASQSAEDETPR